MNSFLHQAAWALMMCWIVGMPLASFAAQPVPAPSATNAVSILTLEGKKEEISVSRSGSDVWDPAYVGQVLKPGDRGRTGSSSRLTLRFSDLSVMRIAEGGSFTIQAPPQADQTHSISLWKGLLYLFHRDKPGSTQINSRTATAATRGTEFTVEVNETSGTMLLSVLAGEGELSNSLGSVTVKPGEQGESVSGVLPRLAPRIDTHRIIQWVLYYPGILSTSELSLSAVDRDRLQPSLTAYDSGDLTAALQRLPAETAQPSPDERVYRAALLVALGQVSKAEGLLTELVAVPAGGVEAKLAQALLRMVQGVRNPAELSRVTESTVERTLATEWIGASYERQAQLNLSDAVESARRATQIDPASGYAWARLAELEFGMGRTRDAERAVQTALKRSPNNAQAHALTGLLRANRGALQEARMAFDEAIRLDGALSTGWLGRGLLKIRAGEVAAGREDLQVAAAMEPQRGVLRSYLAKAWHHQGELKHARKELELARELDPNDPTAALYSALLHLDQNEFNQAIRDLQESKQLNDNRAVYRSRLLLDQDKAVRGANLAAAYEDAGLRELGVSEASRAISSDYANYSSHLFLANIYNDLRDPHQINQRYETPWLSEYLVANLLAPVGAGVLSQAVSQQEYSRFFERDGFGVVSSTEYQSRGDWIQSAAQYGRFGRMSYAIEGSYRSEKGQRANEEFTSRYVNLQFKQELTTQDSLYFQASTFDTDAGDLTPYYNPAQAIGRLRARERSAPSLLMGYHREWSPGSHTLFLAGRLNDAVRQRNPQFTTFTTTTGGSGPIALPTEVDAQYTSDINLYTGEHNTFWNGIITLG